MGALKLRLIFKVFFSHLLYWMEIQPYVTLAEAHKKIRTTIM